MQGFTRITTALAWLAAALFVAAGVMLTYEVVARYFFVRPTIWAAELSQLCLIWGSLLAMAWAMAARRHITVTAFTSLLPERGRAALEVFSLLAVALFSAFVAWHGWHIFLDSWVRGRTTGSLLDLPSWFSEIPVPAGFALLFVQALIEAARILRGEGVPTHVEPQE
ncbi:MAG: TRAP transporter small permease [Flavobacteriaceae bacterium]